MHLSGITPRAGSLTSKPARGTNAPSRQSKDPQVDRGHHRLTSVLACHQQLLLVFCCRRLLETVDRSNAIQDPLQGNHARQEIYRSIHWCVMLHRRMDDIRCCCLGFSLLAALSHPRTSSVGLQQQCKQKSGPQSRDYRSPITGPKPGGNPGPQHLD
jgi:hypothetical protein